MGFKGCATTAVVIFAFCNGGGLLTGVSTAAAKNAEQKKTAPKTPKAKEMPTLDVAGAYSSTQPIVGPAQGQLVKLINAMTDGSIKAKLYEPGELVPPLQYLSAVGTGTLDAAWTTPSAWAAKDSAFWLFTSIPFSHGAREYLAWLKYGGGETLFKQLHAKYNVEALPCGISPAGASGWFMTELNKPEQLEGLKVRASGLAAQVLRNMGAEPQVIKPSEVSRAINLKTIDAAMLDTPALGETAGVEELTKNLYFPAWHQPSTLNELLISKKKWKSLTKTQRAVIQGACDTVMLRQLAEGEALQGKALNQLVEQGIKPLRWSGEILQAFRNSWIKTAEALAAKSPEFKKAWESYSAFVETQKAWSDVSR